MSGRLRHAGEAPAVGLVVVRPARRQDIEGIIRVTLGAWRAGFRGVVPDNLVPDPGDMRERLSHRVGEPSSPVAVGELDGEVQGSIVFGPTRDADAGPEVGEIHALYVHPTAWRRGVGRALVEHALGRLEGDGFREAMLWTFAETPQSHAFYEALGFANDGGTQRRQMSGAALEIRYRMDLPPA